MYRGFSPRPEECRCDTLANTISSRNLHKYVRGKDERRVSPPRKFDAARTHGAKSRMTRRRRLVKELAPSPPLTAVSPYPPPTARP